MKKTLIALALTALPVAAMADVVLYGQIKGGLGVTFQDGNNSQDGTITQMEDYGSRIGFKGEEDLGNGLKAIWQVEQRVSLAGSTKDANGKELTSEGFNTRDTFIGLEGGFGKVRAGYVSDQFNENMETMDIWEYRTGAGAAARGLATMTRFDGRSQGIRYDSPNFGGFDFNITHQFSDSAAEGRYDKPGKDDYGQSTIVGLNYENSGFFAQYGAGYSPSSYTTAPGANGGQSKSGQVHRLEGGYDANNLFVGVGVQYGKGWETSNDYMAALGYDAGVGADTGVETTEAAVTAAYRFGNVTPRVSYAHGWESKIAGDKVAGSKYDQVVLGADYDFSKRTTAMVSAGWLRAGKSNDKTETTAGLVGVRHKF